jgi:hypothetical protein
LRSERIVAIEKRVGNISLREEYALPEAETISAAVAGVAVALVASPRRFSRRSLFGLRERY